MMSDTIQNHQNAMTRNEQSLKLDQLAESDSIQNHKHAKFVQGGQIQSLISDQGISYQAREDVTCRRKLITTGLSVVL